MFIRAWAVAILLGILSPALSLAEGPKDEPRDEPHLSSVFPLAGQRGTTFRAQLLGRRLQGLTGAWCESADLTATIHEVETIEGSPADLTAGATYRHASGPSPTHRVTIDVTVAPDAALGLHGLRVVSPSGMSNAVALLSVAEPVVNAADLRAREGEPNVLLVEPPIVIQGKLESKGSRDRFSFIALRGEHLQFESFSNFRPSVAYRAKCDVTLHEPIGSWFDPQRTRPLDAEGPVLSWELMHSQTRWFDKRDFPAEFVLFPQLRRHFASTGRYLVHIQPFMGAGAPQHFYALRIAPADDPLATRMAFGRPAIADPGDWLERDSSTLRQWGSFPRQLALSRLAELSARAWNSPGTDGTCSWPDARATVEAEPNDATPQDVDSRSGAMISGRIDSPGDRDRYQFSVTAGDRLAFEIETPGAAPPIFNPWLRILDRDGGVVCQNIFKEYGGDGDDVNKNLERKTLHAFAEAGSYQLEVRDLTTREGGPSFSYRILIRPQVPHLGRIELNLDVVSRDSVLVDLTDHLNLRRGEAKELVVVCEREEGLADDIVLHAVNLPPGVELVPGTPSDRAETIMTGFQYRPPGREVMDPKDHRAVRVPMSVVLLARHDAVSEATPRLSWFEAHVVRKGVVGPAIRGPRFPIVVTSKAN